MARSSATRQREKTYQTSESAPLSPRSDYSSDSGSDGSINTLRRSALPIKNFAYLSREMQNVLREGKEFRTSERDRHAILSELEKDGSERLNELRQEFQEMISDSRDLGKVEVADLLSPLYLDWG